MRRMRTPTVGWCRSSVTSSRPSESSQNHNGIYRVHSPDSCTLIADRCFALTHTPDADVFLLAGIPYAIEPYRGVFLDTRDTANRVYRGSSEPRRRRRDSYAGSIPAASTHSHSLFSAPAVSFGRNDPVSRCRSSGRAHEAVASCSSSFVVRWPREA
jgi:hypothetical protein